MSKKKPLKAKKPVMICTVVRGEGDEISQISLNAFRKIYERARAEVLGG